MMFVHSAILVSLNMLLVADLIYGSRTMSLNTIFCTGSEKSKLLSVQRYILSNSRNSSSGFLLPARHGATFENPSSKSQTKSHRKIGAPNGFRMHYNINETNSHLIHLRNIHNNLIQGAAKSLGERNDRQPRTITSTLNVPAKLLLTAPELIRHYNYPVEEHFAVTPDGYILGLHRIPGPRHTPAGIRPQGGRVVLLMHGLFSTSTSFLINGPEYSLGFVLADAGYDVWLGNCRGNTYSRNHTSLNPDEQIQFWQFSQDVMASQDIPTMVRYALQQTASSGLFYIGYSQGTRLFYMAASAENTIVDKVHLFIAMASTGSRESQGARRIISEVVSKFWRVPEAVGIGELLSRSAFKTSLLYWLCNVNSPLNRVCANLLLGYFSDSVPQNPLISQTMIPYVLTNILGGSSVRQFAHFNQFARGKFQKFDFGSSENEQVYGSSDPPSYDVTAVTCPTALYWGPNDPITPEEDVLNLAATLPNLVTNYKVPNPDFNHIDFLYSERAKDLVYDHVISLMSQY